MSYETVNLPFIDAHIHLDAYEENDQLSLLQDITQEINIHAVIAVSMNKSSSEKNLSFARTNEKIHAAFGFHPEQPLVTNFELDALFSFMEKHLNEMSAVSEVGLPYYSRLENPDLSYTPYIHLLERFIQFAARHNKPIILHAVYEDTDLVCDLLEQYQIKKAHFHWWKGSQETLHRIISNGYFISVTPDVLYEEEIQSIVKQVPIEQLMVETDGPWPFEGVFLGKPTHPLMIQQSIQKISELYQLQNEQVAKQLLYNTVQFYSI